MMLKQKMKSFFSYLILIIGFTLSSPIFATTTITGLSDQTETLGSNIDFYTRYYPRDAIPYIYDISVKSNNNPNMFYMKSITITKDKTEQNTKNIPLTLILNIPENLIDTGIKTSNGHIIFRTKENNNIGFIFDIGFTDSPTSTELEPVTSRPSMISQNVNFTPVYERSCVVLIICGPSHISNYKYTGNISVRIRPVVYSPIAVGGAINMTSNTIAKIALSIDDITTPDSTIALSAFQLVNYPYTCRINDSDKNKTVNLNPISVTDLLNGQNLDAGSFSIGVNCGNINTNGHTPMQITSIYAVMTDQNQPSNRSNILTLMTNGKENPSIGLQIIKPDNTAISYGPSSSNKGTENQWLFASNSRGLNGTQPNMTFNVKYILRNRPVIPGDVTGTATITFSYQ